MDPQTPSASKKTSLGLDENVEGALCYLFGWVTGLIFLLVEKNSKFVRFHAMQSLIESGILSALTIAANFIPGGFLVGFVIGPLHLILWILLMIKAYQGEYFKLPVIGDIAEQQASK